jgi:hypothetical protein
MNISQQSDNCNVHLLKNKSTAELGNQKHIYYTV